jgi:hypothetical protein
MHDSVSRVLARFFIPFIVLLPSIPELRPGRFRVQKSLYTYQVTMSYFFFFPKLASPL